MTYDEIYKLADTLPDNSRALQLSGGGGLDIPNSKEVVKFTICYKDLSFLWNYAKSFTDRGSFAKSAHFYVTPETESIINRVSSFIRGGQEPEVAHAVAIDRALPALFKNTIQGCLLADDFDLDSVATEVGLPPAVIELYEKIFFNVLDRRKESLFVASLVHPEGRVAELDTQQQYKTSNNAKLRQAGYHNGVEDVYMLAGMRGYGTGDDTRTAVKEFERKMMVNALWLARNGFLNTTHVGISNAKNLIAAAKHGGDNDSASEGDEVGNSVGATLMAEVVSVSREEILERQEYMESRQVS